MEELVGINLSKVKTLDFKIPHRNWNQAFAEAYVYMTTASPGEVISIFGPTRAGKTSLLEELIATICGTHKFENEMPVVKIEVDNNGGKAAFSYRSFIMETLELMNHPVYSSIKNDGWSDPNRVDRNERAKESTLVHALIECFKQRRTLFWVIDEVQHLKYAGKNVMAAAGVLDALKTLAKKANVILVICGTYPILESMTRSGHFEARKHDVHLGRYRQTEEDIKEFLWILSNYNSELDIDPSLGSLEKCAELLYEGSLGCIGLLRACLYRASVYAAIERKRIGLDHIYKSLKSSNQMLTTAAEIRLGEELLGLKPCSVVEAALENEEDKEKKSAAKKQNKGTCFQRKPKRYSSGNRL